MNNKIKDALVCLACLGDNLPGVKNTCYACEKPIITNSNYDPWGDFRKFVRQFKRYKKETREWLAADINVFERKGKRNEKSANL